MLKNLLVVCLFFLMLSELVAQCSGRPYWRDADRDGYADPNNSTQFSFAPPHYYSTGTDCNDRDSRIHPKTVWYYDKDGDGFGDDKTSFVGCSPFRNMYLKEAT